MIKRRQFFFLSGGVAIAGLDAFAQPTASNLPFNPDYLIEPPDFRFVSIADSDTEVKGQYGIAGAIKRYYANPIIVQAISPDGTVFDRGI